MAEPVSWFIITTGVAGLGVVVTLAGVVAGIRRDRRKRRERRAQQQQAKESYLAVREMLISFS